MTSITPWSDCVKGRASNEYLTILYSSEGGFSKLLFDWEIFLRDLQETIKSHGLKVKVCQADVMNGVIPEALVRAPFKSYLTQEYRREELP